MLDSGEVKLSVGDSVDLTGTDVESLAVCDDVAWAVTSTGTSRTLQRVRITSEGDLELADETASVSGSEVACGELPSGSVAVAATSGSWVSYSYSAGTGFTTASSGDVGAVIHSAATE